MIKIEKYDESYDKQIQEFDMVTYFTIKYHADVLKDSIRVALDGDRLTGIGYLKAGATYLKVDSLDLPYYFVHAEFPTDPGADPEAQVEASELLIEELKNEFDKLQASHPGKRLILRVWSGAEKIDYIDFLMYHAFRPMRVTPIMVRELTDEDAEFTDAPDSLLINEDCDDTPAFITLPTGEKLPIREMDPNDDSFAKAYTVTNREAFEVEDSISELRFTMRGPDSHVFAVMKGDRVIAATTLWSVSEDRAATENIFCAKDYRHMGITTALLSYVFGFLQKKGYVQASLTVFGDNQPATQLYMKLGYEVSGTLLEFHYEKDYQNIGF